jgi:hypothetical protein
MLQRVVWWKFTDISGVLAASVIREMSDGVLLVEIVDTSETSVNF